MPNRSNVHLSTDAIKTIVDIISRGDSVKVSYDQKRKTVKVHSIKLKLEHQGENKDE